MAYTINMSCLSVGVLLLVFCMRLASGGISSSCQSGGDQAIVPDSRDRIAYYVCVNGRMERFQCPPGFYFDTAKPACTPKKVARFRRFAHPKMSPFLASEGFLKEILHDAIVVQNVLHG